MTASGNTDRDVRSPGAGDRGAPRPESAPGDVIAVLDTIDIPLVVIGRDANVTRFNRAATETLGVTRSDLHRHISNMQALARIENLEDMCTRVMTDGVSSRHDIRNGDRWFQLQISPLGGAGASVGGAVLTFTNVTAFRATIARAIYEREYTKTILNTVTDPLVVLDARLNVQTANRAFYDWFGVSREEAQRIPLSELGDAQWKASDLWVSLRATLAENRDFQPFELDRVFPNGQSRGILLNARRLVREDQVFVLVTFRDITELRHAQEVLRRRARSLELQKGVAVTLIEERELEKIVQAVTDAAREISGAQFGAFFYNAVNERGETYTFYTLSGAPREAFARFPMPRNTALFGPTFRGEGIVRIADVRVDPRFGKNAPHHGMPEGHLPVVSYLALPVKSRSGEILGGLFFGHAEAGVFTEEGETAVAGLAAQAAIAIDNVRLYRALESELVRVKRAEEGSRRLASIVESSDDAIISKDLAGIITSWNAGAERLFNYKAGEIVGRSVLTLIPPDRHHEEPFIRERLGAGQQVEHYETVRQRKDGSLIDVSLTVSPIKDESGKIVGGSKIARDITARRRTEGQQRALHDMLVSVSRAAALPQIYDAALSAMEQCLHADRGAILLYDDAQTMRFVASRGLSEGYRRAVEGHSPWRPDEEEAKPITIEDVRAAGLEPRLEAVVESEGIRALAFVPLTYERRLKGKLMLYYNRPHRFEVTELEMAMAIASQVTFALERQKGALALEALVADRTQSLRVAIAQMEEFSYSVSHDLRSPTRAMQGYAEVLLEDYGDRLGEEGRGLLERIQRAGGRMDRLIQDLLTYSRISRREMKLEAVSLARLIPEVIQQYPEMRPKCAEIEMAADLPEVLGHEPSLTQVISNLLCNAIKFVPPGRRPCVHIAFERRADTVRVNFVDNGIGIPPEFHRRLFGMFERLHADKNYEGTGIGLAIVRKAMERMNGKVGVESDGVNGSRFWIELDAPKS